MKIQYKNILIGVFVVSLMTPFYSFAAFEKGKENKIVKDKNGFCSKLGTISDKILNELNQKSEKFLGRKENRTLELTQRWLERDETRNDNWSDQDARINARIDALMTKADTDAKKEAVKKFKEAAESAINTRRSSVNTAVSTFRNGVKGLVDNKFGNIDTRVTTLKNSVEQAIGTAKNSCDNGVPENTVRATFRDSVKNAHNTFRQDKTDLIIRDDINELASERRSSINQAIDKFKADMEKAKADLKVAFNG